MTYKREQLRQGIAQLDKLIKIQDEIARANSGIRLPLDAKYHQGRRDSYRHIKRRLEAVLRSTT